MVNILDMQDLRYLNLFEKIMGVRTRFCLRYNEALVFCVPKPLVSKSIGEGGRNIKKMNYILGKRIRVVAIPRGTQDMEYFIRSIVNPVTFKDVEVRDDEVILSAGASKAALIGRNKKRLQEMQKIVRVFFGKEFRIV